MADEEIKQKAEEYANGIYDKNFQNSWWKECRQYFIVGAKSRNEEVKELEHKVSKLENRVTKLNAKIDTLKEKINNPWIKQEDGLPEEGDWVTAQYTAYGDVEYATFKVTDFYLRGDGDDKKLYYRDWLCEKWILLKKGEKKSQEKL